MGWTLYIDLRHWTRRAIYWAPAFRLITSWNIVDIEFTDVANVGTEYLNDFEQDVNSTVVFTFIMLIKVARKLIPRVAYLFFLRHLLIAFQEQIECPFFAC